jgi:hypothetical protein
MRRIAGAILTGSLEQYEAQSVFTKLHALLETLSLDGTALFSWPSSVRNEVQYRHGHDVWLPCGIKKQDRERLGRLFGPMEP